MTIMEAAIGWLLAFGGGVVLGVLIGVSKPAPKRRRVVGRGVLIDPGWWPR